MEGTEPITATPKPENKAEVPRVLINSFTAPTIERRSTLFCCTVLITSNGCSNIFTDADASPDAAPFLSPSTANPPIPRGSFCTWCVSGSLDGLELEFAPRSPATL
eukprot:3592646-Rhodomonas_salina.1